MLAAFSVLLGAGALAGTAIAGDKQKKGEHESEIRFVASDALKAGGFPLSNLVEVDGWILLSGALGTKPGVGLVPGGIEAETRQTMENIKASLKSEGLGMDRIVKCTVMLADMAEWATFNEVYKEFFDGVYPARSAFGASGLAVGARVEVECMARR
ncbi:MAG: RidA family protein [Pseudomonadota bacterium]